MGRHIVLALLVFVGVIATTSGAIFGTDTEVLLNMMNTMKGLPPSWQPSTVDTACSTYFGITCVSNVAVPGYAGTFDRVKTIIFPTCDNVTRINGTLPENIGLLTELREIEIDACDMGGQIPNSLFMLPKISTVRLQENFFTGSLPEHLSESITELNLYRNMLTGSIPISYGKHNALRILRLTNNHLQCPLPLDLFKNLTRISNGQYFSDGFVSTCEMHNNEFGSSNGMICGTIPFGTYNCAIAPLFAPMPSATRVSATSFSSTFLRIDVEGDALVVSVLNGTQMLDTYFIWQLKSYQFGNYHALFDSFIPPFTFESPTKTTILARFTDGLVLKFIFDIPNAGTDYESIKVGFEHHTFPPVRAPYDKKMTIDFVQFVKTPLDRDSHMSCGIMEKRVAKLILDNFGQEFTILRCDGSEANFTGVVVLVDPLFDNAAVQFGFESELFRLVFSWSLMATIDGRQEPIESGETLVYSESMIELGDLERMVKLGLPVPPIADLKDQWLGTSLEFEIGYYNRTFIFDPDIRLFSLFDLGGDDGVQTGAIVGAVIGGVLGAGIIASLSIRPVRERVYPFLRRKKQSKDYAVTTLNEAELADNSQTASGTWQVASTRSTNISNMK